MNNRLIKNKFFRENLILVIILALLFPSYAFSDAWVADTGNEQVSRLYKEGHAPTVISVAGDPKEDVSLTDSEIRVNTNPTALFYPGLKLSFGDDRKNVYEIQSIKFDGDGQDSWIVEFYNFNNKTEDVTDSPIYMELVRAGGFAEPVAVSANQSNERVWITDKSDEDSSVTQLASEGRIEPPDTAIVTPYYYSSFDAGDTMFNLYSEDTGILPGMKIDFKSDNRAKTNTYVLEIKDIDKTTNPNILTTISGLPADHSIIGQDTALIHIDRFRDKTSVSPQDVSANSISDRTNTEYDTAWAANTGDGSVVKYEKWNFRKKLSIDYTKIDANLENFPLCVKLDSSRIDYNNTKDAGADIRFTDSEGNPLKYEIEKWDKGSNSVVWVKVPEISSADTTIIYMYYGNPSAQDAQDTENVWDSNYMMVQHLEEDSSDTRYDSTFNSNDGTPLGSISKDTAAQIDGADEFTSGDSIIVPDSSSLAITGNITISLWVKVTDFVGYRGLVGKTKNDIPAPYDYYLDDGIPSFSGGSGVVSDSVPATSSPSFGWQYLAVRMSGTEVTHYLNGTPNGTGTISAYIRDANKTLRIGSSMEGTIDEVRISNIARSSAWIKASYYSECDTPSAHLVTFGDEENIRYAGVSKVKVFNSPKSISVNSSNGEAWVATPEPNLKLYGGSYASSGSNRAKVYRYDGGSTWTDLGKFTPFGNPGSSAYCLAVYNNKLYVGTADQASVFYYDGSTWKDTWLGGSSVYSLVVYDGKLYAGTDSSNGARVYRYDGGHSWTDVGRLGSDEDVLSLAVYNDQLYAGTYPSGGVYRYDGGTTWEPVGGLGNHVFSLAVYDDGVYGEKLYAGTYPSGHVYRYDGPITSGGGGYKWTDLGHLGPLIPPLGANTSVDSLIVYNGKLYGGTSPSGHVYRYDGLDSEKHGIWSDLGQLGSNDTVTSLAVYNGKLHAGTSPSGHVYRYNGPNNWTDLGQLDTKQGVYSLAVYDETLHYDETTPSYAPAVVKLSKDGYKTINATINQYHSIGTATITLTDTSELDTGINISFGNNLTDVYMIGGIESDTQIVIASPLKESLGAQSQWFPIPWLLERGNGEASSPQIAISGTNAVSVWQQNDGAANSIYSNYSIDGGTSWGDSQLLELGSEEADSPQIAMSGSTAVAVWQQSDGAANSIYSNYSTDGGATWHDSQILEGTHGKWQYRKPIFIDHTKIDTDLTDFPLCVELNPTRIDYSNTQDSGQDIRFVSSEDTPLKYEIEKWDETDTSTIWVKIPKVSSTDSTIIYMYYGNPDATDAQDAANVWDSNFKLVTHMKDDPNVSSIKDSTTYANNGTKTSANKPIETAGEISKAQNFLEDPVVVQASTVIGTSTISSATQYPNQRKTFYAAGLHWVWYVDGTNFGYRTSADGATWSSFTSVGAVNGGAAYGYSGSACFDGTYVHYVRFTYPTGTNYIYYRRGTPVSDGSITWNAAEQLVITNPGNYNYLAPMIAIDSNGYAWIGMYRSVSAASTTYLPLVFKNANNNGTWSTASGFPYALSATNDTTWRVSILPLTGGKVYAIYSRDGQPGKGKLWNGSTWGSEETTMADAELGYGHSAVANGDDIYLVYLNNTLATGIMYNKRIGSTGLWGTEAAVQASAATAMVPVLSMDPATNNLYCFWAGAPTAVHIYYKKCVNGTWDTNPTDTNWSVSGQPMQSYESGGDLYETFYGATTWKSQSFISTINDNLFRVEFYLQRGAGTNNVPITVKIYAADAQNKPTGSALYTGTISSFTPGGGAAWRTHILTTPLSVLAGQKYCLVLGAPTGTAAQYYQWYVDSTSPTYTDGNWAFSADTELTWTADINKDGYFRALFESSFPSNDTLSCFYQSYSSKIGVEYMTRGATPYNVKFGFLQLPSTVKVNMGSNASLNLNTAGTLEAWVSDTGTTNSNMYIVGTEDITTDTNGYSLSAHQNRILFEIADTTLSNKVDVTPSLGTTWHNIVGTWNGTNLKLYQDGTNIGTAVQTLNPNPISASGLWIGADPQNAFKRNFSGTIDEVRISDVARSSAWIKAQYNSMIDNLITFGNAEETATTLGPIPSLDIAMDGNKVVVVWQQNSSTYYNYSINGGTSWYWGGSQLLGQGNDAALSPQVAMSGNNAAAVWQGSEGWMTLGGFYYPYGISYDSSTGYIYVADTVNHRIVKTKMDGTGWTAYGSYGSGAGQFSGPEGISYDSSTGYIYVLDSGNDRIVKTKMDGTGWTTLGGFTSYIEGGISYDSSTGYIYVADTDNSRIIKTKIDGTGWTTLGGFAYPYGISYDSSTGYIYVSDEGNSSIVKTKIDGSGWTILGGFSWPTGISYDSSTGYIYVTDIDNSCIIKTKIDGTGWTTYGSAGSGAGQFSGPEGISYDSSTGYIYVADTGNSRIVKTKGTGIGGGNIVSSYSINSGASWSDSQLLEMGSEEADSPQIAMSGNNAVAVWQQSSSVYSNYSSDGGATWGDSQLLEQGNGGASSPQIAINSDTAVAVWQQYDGPVYSIYSNYSSDGGATWHDSQLLEMDNDWAFSPQIAINSDTAVAVWKQYDGTANSIYFNYSSDGGATWHDSQLIEQDNGEASSPQVAMSGNNAVAVWQQDDGDTNSIFAYNIFLNQPSFVTPSFTIPVGRELARIDGFLNPISVSVNSNSGDCWVADDDPNTDTDDTVVWIKGNIGEADITTAGYDITNDVGSHKIIKGFNNPVSVAVDPVSGDCWVACQGEDGGDSYIVRLDKEITNGYDISGSGNLHTKIYGFSSPTSVSVDPSTGECWVVDSGDSQIVRLAPEGHRYTGYTVLGSYAISDTEITLANPTTGTSDTDLYRPLKVSFGSFTTDIEPVYELKSVSYPSADTTIIELASGLEAVVSGGAGVYKELARVGGVSSPKDVSAFRGPDLGQGLHPWGLQIRELYVVDKDKIPVDQDDGWEPFPAMAPVHDATPQFRWKYLDVDGSGLPLKSYQIQIYTINKEGGNHFVPVWDSDIQVIQPGIDIMPGQWIYTDWDKVSGTTKENDSTSIYSADHYSPPFDLDDCPDLSQIFDDVTDTSTGDHTFYVQLTVKNKNDVEDTYPELISDALNSYSPITFTLDRTPPGAYLVCGTGTQESGKQVNVPATTKGPIKINNGDSIANYLQTDNYYWDEVCVEWDGGNTEIVQTDSPWIPTKDVTVRVKVKDRNNENLAEVGDPSHKGHNPATIEFDEKDTDCSGISINKGSAQYRYSLATSPEPRVWSQWQDCSEIRLYDETILPYHVGNVIKETDETRNTFVWLYANVKFDNGDTNLIQFRIKDEGNLEVKKDLNDTTTVWITPNMGYSHADTESVEIVTGHPVEFQVASNTYGYSIQINADVPQVILTQYPSNPFPHTYASFRWTKIDTTECRYKSKLEHWTGTVWTTDYDPSYYDPSNDIGDWSLVPGTTDATSTSFENLTVGTWYRFLVKAKDQNGSSCVQSLVPRRVSADVIWVWYVSPEVPDTIITYGPSDQTSGDVTFRFTGVGGMPPYEYRHYLIGKDSGWTGWVPLDNSASYLGLKEGTYIFEVQAREQNNHNNFDQTPARKIFTVVDPNHPPYSTVSPDNLYKYFREIGE